MNKKVELSTIVLVVVLFLYTAIGTSGDVEEIKSRAPQAISERGWTILRYEGYQFGSFSKHGGKVWYHVKNSTNENIQYRVYITIWNDELQFHYDSPEKLQRLNVNIVK